VTLAEIWEELERVTPPGSSGRVKRRIKPETKCDLFLAIAKPSNHRMVLMPVAAESLVGVEELPTSRGVEARIARPGDDGHEAAVEIVLTDPNFVDVFTALATDIAGSVTIEADEPEAVRALVGRLGRWQRFLEESGPGGLNAERQRGLFGELWLLRQYLLSIISPIQAVRSWTGPSRAPHDFQLGACAIEVKCTTAKQHQALRITSERQLDETGIDSLFLFHLSLDAHLDAGESLPALVDDIRASLSATAAASALEDRLMQAGYLDVHRHLYGGLGYTIRESNFFRVTDGFPRIIERDLAAGVGDVHYSVAVSECKHFVIDVDQVLSEIGNEHALS
jgi:hypothetical protein